MTRTACLRHVSRLSTRDICVATHTHVETLRTQLFAPTDDAFGDLLKRLQMTEDQLLANSILLTRVLDYHIVPQKVIMEDDMEDGTELPTVARMPPIIGKRQKLAIRRGADDSIVLDGFGSDAKVVEVRCACVPCRLTSVRR